MKQEVKQIKKRKLLLNRCPGCESSQIRHRKFLNDWKCSRCGEAFKEPKCDQS